MTGPGFSLLMGLGCLCAGAGGDAPVPQPGDVLLATDVNWFWSLTHNMAFAFEPHNSAIVVQRADGSLGVLEAGPNDTTRCTILPMLPHLKEYCDKGPVW